MYCQRCQTHAAQLVFGGINVCAPCAEQLAWQFSDSPALPAMTKPLRDGDYLASGIGDVTPFGVVVPPIGIAESLGLMGQGGLGSISRRGAPPPSSGFSVGSMLLLLGGVAAVGFVGLVAYNMFKTAEDARALVKQHPELVAAAL